MQVKLQTLHVLYMYWVIVLHVICRAGLSVQLLLLLWVFKNTNKGTCSQWRFTYWTMLVLSNYWDRTLILKNCIIMVMYYGRVMCVMYTTRISTLMVECTQVVSSMETGVHTYTRTYTTCILRYTGTKCKTTWKAQIWPIYHYHLHYLINSTNYRITQALHHYNYICTSSVQVKCATPTNCWTMRHNVSLLSVAMSWLAWELTIFKEQQTKITS